jgi:hypothetical protein
MKELRFWSKEEKGIRDLQRDIEVAKNELERYGCNDEGAIVNIIVADGFGRYIPQVLFSRLGIYTSDDDYPFEIGSEEEILAFDELLEEIDEELQELVEEYDLVPTGFTVHFGWNDGEIRTMLYPIS